MRWASCPDCSHFPCFAVLRDPDGRIVRRVVPRYRLSSRWPLFLLRWWTCPGLTRRTLFSPRDPVP